MDIMEQSLVTNLVQLVSLCLLGVTCFHDIRQETCLVSTLIFIYDHI